MPAGNTYEAIATQTVTGSAAATVTFSSIPSTYTDLVLVMQPAAGFETENVGIRFNSDTGNNYSYTKLTGNGSTATSTRATNFSRINMCDSIGTTTTLGNLTIICNIMNYANSTTNKTTLSRSNQATGTYPGVETMVGLWRNTAAITSVTAMQSGSATFSIGSTFSLYGIASA